MSFLAAFSRRFPGFAPVNARIISKEVPMDTLSKQIRDLRIEYWLRTFESIPKTIAESKAQSKLICEAIKNPGNITYKNLGTALVWAVQIFGCFCIGEVLGRGDLVGYPVGDYPGAKKDH